MPRKRQRFSRLKAFLKQSNGAPTAGSEADKYLKFISGQANYKVVNAQGGGARDRALVSLLPFNKTTTLRYGAFITRYAYSNQDEAGITPADAGQEKYNPGTEAGKSTYDSAYNAAIIIWRSNAVQNSIAPNPTKTSQITGKNYYMKGGRSGVSPFGKKVATDMEDDRAKDLQSTARTKTGNLGATYQPEEWNAPFTPKDAVAAFGGTP